MFCCCLVVGDFDVDGGDEVEDFYPGELFSCRMPKVLGMKIAEAMFALLYSCQVAITQVQKVGLRQPQQPFLVVELILFLNQVLSNGLSQIQQLRHIDFGVVELTIVCHQKDQINEGYLLICCRLFNRFDDHVDAIDHQMLSVTPINSLYIFKKISQIHICVSHSASPSIL
jgi:hypothetical protein